MLELFEQLGYKELLIKSDGNIKNLTKEELQRLCVLCNLELEQVTIEEKATAAEALAAKLKAVSEFVTTIPQDKIDEYKIYWSTIIPKTHKEYFNRWLFAFLSVHTSWKANVKAYVMIDKEDGMSEKEKLMNLVVASGVGLHQTRTAGMWKFKEDFWADPTVWYRKPDESWIAFRDRLMDR